MRAALVWFPTGAIDDVAELADVAGPAVAEEQGEGVVGDLGGSVAMGLAEGRLHDEGSREALDLPDPLAERWEQERDAVETLEEIPSETALARLSIEPAVEAQGRRLPGFGASR